MFFTVLVFFVSLPCSHDFVSVIFGILGKFCIDIGHALHVGGNGSRENPSRKKFLMLEILFRSSRHARTN